MRDVFSRLADLDDELDSLSPVGRDADSLASQADAVKGFLSRLANLRTELESHASECTTMLRREGSSPDLLALRRETEALSRQAGKVSDEEDDDGCSGGGIFSALIISIFVPIVFNTSSFLKQ